MKYKAVLLVACILCAGCSCSHYKPQPVPVIFDTDMGPDYDDVGALAILHALADSGEAKILATVTSNRYIYAVPCIELINTYFKHPDIPLGAPAGPDVNDRQRFPDGYWAEILPAKYPHKVKNTADAPDAVQVYRQILSNQPDTSVNIITVGFFTNLAALLQSPPDRFSELDGKALVRKKVRRLVSMAGSFPQGREFNVFIDSTASVTVFNQWPTPILLSGFQIGEAILTGLRLTATDVQDNPVKDAFSLCLKVDVNGRYSWDQTAVLVGVRGVRNYFGTVKGRMIVLPDGSNTWQDDPDGPHEYLVWKMPIAQLTGIIEDLMMYQPN
jgi:inosine-uridine nucleoside N-ribohydrolase